jgi:hypothetical protein
MTQITTGPDGQTLFDGHTVADMISATEKLANLMAYLDSDQAGAMRALAAALRHLSEWQPIPADVVPGTAPWDGKRIMVWRLGAEPRVAGYMTSLEEGDEAWIVARELGSNPIAFAYADPTHWRPLPPGPMEATP